MRYPGYSGRIRTWLGLSLTFINLMAIAWLFIESSAGILPFPIKLGGFGGFNVGETVLIFDSLMVFGLFFYRYKSLNPAARPLLWLVIGSFALGLLLASAKGSLVHLRVISYHALWHIVSAYGLIFLWAFVHVDQEHGVSEAC